MSFESLPIELFWLIANHLELPYLKEMASTCTFMFNLLDPYLYRKAFESDEYKSRFLYAVVYGQTNAVSKFLQTGVLMSEFKDYTGYCPQYDRPSSVSVEKREALKKKFHPLLAAAFFGYVDVTKMLLSEGKANIHFQDDFEKTALHWAVEADHPDIIKVLLEQGAGIKDARGKNKITKSPLVYAAELGNKYAVELMVNELRNRGSQFDLRVLKNQCGKACYEACRNGYSDIVDFCLRQGVDVNLSIEQRPLLYWATIQGNLSTVKVLVKYGARMEHERDCGVVTALISSGSSCIDDVRIGVSTEKALHLLRSGCCNVANGDMLACALWCIAKCSGTTGHRWYATSDQREEMMRLMRKNGFDEKNCRHNCFKRRSDSLKDKLDRGELIRYVTNQGLRNGIVIDYA